MLRAKWIPAVLAIALSLVLGGCGGSGGAATRTAGASSQRSVSKSPSDRSSDVVARVGAVAITRAEVSQWMTAIGGESFNYVSHGSTAPEGLLADPPDYQRCVSTLEAAAAKSPLGHAREDAAELLEKCRELNRSFQLNATYYLVNRAQIIQIARGLGVSAPSSAIQATYRATTAREYPGQALRRFMISRKKTLPELLLEAQITYLSQKMYPMLHGAAARRYLALRAQVTAHTSCKQGYVVEGCGAGAKTDYKTAPSALMEQVSALRYGWCADLRGCAKQVGK